MLFFSTFEWMGEVEILNLKCVSVCVCELLLYVLDVSAYCFLSTRREWLAKSSWRKACDIFKYCSISNFLLLLSLVCKVQAGVKNSYTADKGYLEAIG